MTRIFSQRNNTILTGYASQGGINARIPIKIGNTTEYAISLNVESPGNVNLFYANNQWYAYTEIVKKETRINKITNRHYKDNEVILSKYDYYLELLDLAGTLDTKEIVIDRGSYVLNKNTIITKLKDLLYPKINSGKVGTSKFKVDYLLAEFKEYLISHSSSIVSFNKATSTYLEYIDERVTSGLRFLRYLDLPRSTKLKKTSKNIVTMFTPVTIHRFFNFPSVDLSYLFNTPIPALARDSENYNPNFILIWRLITVKSSLGSVLYGQTKAFGYVTLDGKLNRIDSFWLVPQGSYLDLSGVWHHDSNDIYSSYLNLQIGGMDRSSLVINPASYTGLAPTVKVTTGNPRVLFPLPTNEQGNIFLPFSDARNVIPDTNGELLSTSSYVHAINKSTPFQV